MSKLDRIITKPNGRTKQLPFICSWQYCFFDGIIDDYPYFSRYHATKYIGASMFHLPCAMVLNVI